MLQTVVLFAGVFSVWAAILQFQLRHAGLTALVLFAPFPFGCMAAMTAAPANAYAPLSYVFGIVIAQAIGVRIVRGICDGLTSSAAVSQAIREEGKAAGPIVLGFVAWIFAANLHPFAIENLAGAAAVFAFLIGIPIVMLLARWLPYSEQFVSRANQAREWRERVSEHLLFITETRWAFSVTGVALIFFALSALGMRSLQIQEGILPIRLTALVAIALICAIALTRNWRLSVALTLTLSLLGAIGLWIFARGVLPMQQQTLLMTAILLAIAAVPLASAVVAVSRYIRDGDDAVLAIARGYQDECANAVLSAAIVVVPWVVFSFAGVAARLELAISVASLVAAPLIFPAFVGAIYAVFPRYRTVDEVFGKR